MIVLQNTVISDDVRDQFFVCNLEKCKGACCVEGDLGAPLEEEELKILEENYAHIKPYMTGAGQQAVEDQGLYIKDWEGDYSTPTIGNRECAYAIYDADKTLKCAIEQAYYDGKIDWKKPISCHLYPIRITKYDGFEALNYDRWGICSAACNFGQDLGVRVYQFLKEPLIRKYGEGWYAELEQLMENGKSGK
ncbi:DUF3109 family protein [Pontibacter akesuensis]|uniref:DUF3109 family protein n=1 Tax=Pontibacter akesuensis TaxID=388950 RepID=A0A1I7FP74_9BACT|nr:DUF3109 family protein [Pontibacter akesuensis]GHA61191.1 hypothetical protein GCM10007389_12000 [Pontibacter akesuensis]SFU37983.1 Protein of unknown function [Pontibacter akesuensis]